MRRLVGATLCALALTACGSGSSGARWAAKVTRAADITAQAPGYRLAGSGTMSGGPTGAIHMSLSGVFDRRDRVGKLITTVQAAGRHISVPEVIAPNTVYMSAAALPNLSALTGGKPWVKLNMARAIGAGGLSSMPTATDPSQFVDYLRAVSSSTTRIGTAAVRGVQTTHYHAVVDLDRYSSLVSSSERKAVAASVKNLEAALGSHTMPLDVWIDGSHLVRRVGVHFGECVSGARFQFNMNVDLFDYGTQRRAAVPAASTTYDLTPLVQSALRRSNYGCT